MARRLLNRLGLPYKAPLPLARTLPPHQLAQVEVDSSAGQSGCDDIAACSSDLCPAARLLYGPAAMLFIHPMWLHESQRRGKRKCTPTGYVLHVTADLLGLVGLLCLFALPVWGAFRGWSGLHLGIAIGLGLASELLFQASWWLARRRGFQYDDHRCEASWIEAGQRRTYRYGDDWNP